MQSKEIFKKVLDQRLVEPFVEWARGKGQKFGRNIVPRAQERIDQNKPLTRRQKVAQEYALEFLLSRENQIGPAVMPAPGLRYGDVLHT